MHQRRRGSIQFVEKFTLRGFQLEAVYEDPIGLELETELEIDSAPLLLVGRHFLEKTSTSMEIVIRDRHQSHRG